LLTTASIIIAIPDAPTLGNPFGRGDGVDFPGFTFSPAKRTHQLPIPPPSAVIDFAADEKARKQAVEQGLLTCMVWLHAHTHCHHCVSKFPIEVGGCVDML
jgi:proteasome lid subunit RPN8/RPN11